MSVRTRVAKGFTLVEILIVVVILGILAAIVIPQFTNASETAKASNLRSQLQTIRGQLELYQIEHNGVYPALGTDWTQMTGETDEGGTVAAGSDYGPYLQKDPSNPFTANPSTTAADESTAVADGATALGTAVATVGWVYNRSNGQIKASVADAKALQTGLIDTTGTATEEVVPY